MNRWQPTAGSLPAVQNASAKSVSFAAAETFPFKLVALPAARDCIASQRIEPIHVQLNPTNRCNQRCTFCSCSERDVREETPLEEMLALLRKFAALGTRAITITGGGEPTLYPYLGEVVAFLPANGIKVGLVTNGRRLRQIRESVPLLTWCRISLSDERPLSTRLAADLREAIAQAPSVDWSFSYVVTSDFKPERLLAALGFARSTGIRHVRVVSDILSETAVPLLDLDSSPLAEFADLLIYQTRRAPVAGQNPCYLSLLKPNVAPSGEIYPCCGVQFASAVATRRFPEQMSMGRDIDALYARQQFFDGSGCVRCYYGGYNTFMRVLMGTIEHLEFV